jgi:hypothetical protein
MIDRNEFERRLLALVRDYMDSADELHPDGYDIEDFMVVYQLRIALPADEPLKAWDGGPQPGSRPSVACSSTSRSWWQEEHMLTEILDMIRNARWESADSGEGDAEGDDTND